MKTLKDLSFELNKDPEYKKQLRQQRPFYSLTREIYNRRKELGITQAELARRTSTRQSAISRIEVAEMPNIRLKTIVKIAEALDAWVEIRFVPNMHLGDEEYPTIKAAGGGAETQSYTPSTTSREWVGAVPR